MQRPNRITDPRRIAHKMRGKLTIVHMINIRTNSNFFNNLLYKKGLTWVFSILSDSWPSVAAVVSAEDITAQSASPNHIAAAAARSSFSS